MTFLEKSEGCGKQSRVRNVVSFYSVGQREESAAFFRFRFESDASGGWKFCFSGEHVQEISQGYVLGLTVYPPSFVQMDGNSGMSSRD